MLAQDAASLEVMIHEGVVDFSLWNPPHKVGSRAPEAKNENCHQLFKDVLNHEVAVVMGLNKGDVTFRKRSMWRLKTSCTGMALNECSMYQAV